MGYESKFGVPNQGVLWALFSGTLGLVLAWGVAGAAIAWWYFRGATRRAEVLLNLDRLIESRKSEFERLTSEVQGLRRVAPPNIPRLTEYRKSSGIG